MKKLYSNLKIRTFIIDIKPLPDFKFISNDTVDVFGNRGDIINKDMLR